MMQIVKENGNYFFFNQVEILSTLENKNYLLCWDSKGNSYISDTEPFKLPSKVFEVDKEFVDQVLLSARVLPHNVGIFLQGYRGQGKSITAKIIANKLELPVIIINRSIPSSVDFVSKLNEIHMDCVIFIDEFEKLFMPQGYDKEGNFHDQSSFLSFMDGAVSSSYKRIFIFTANEEIDKNFINRPARIRYFKKYEFIDEGLYNNIISEKLRDKEFEEDLRQNLPLFDCTIDLLNSIIEEINVHGKPYSSFKDFFNHKARSIVYTREIYDGTKFIYLDQIEEDSPITRSSTRINGSWNARVVDVKGKSIIYKVKESVDKATGMPVPDDVDSEDLELIYKDVTYKLEKIGSPSPF